MTLFLQCAYCKNANFFRLKFVFIFQSCGFDYAVFCTNSVTEEPGRKSSGTALTMAFYSVIDYSIVLLLGKSPLLKLKSQKLYCVAIQR